MKTLTLDIDDAMEQDLRDSGLTLEMVLKDVRAQIHALAEKRRVEKLTQVILNMEPAERSRIVAEVERLTKQWQPSPNGDETNATIGSVGRG